MQKTLTIGINDLPDTLTASFTSLGVNDGWVLESGQGSNAGGTLDAASQTSRLGNDTANRRYRSVLAFNTASLPNNAVITKVTLKIKRQGVVGADPFATFKNLDGGYGQAAHRHDGRLADRGLPGEGGAGVGRIVRAQAGREGLVLGKPDHVRVAPGGCAGSHAVPSAVQRERTHQVLTTCRSTAECSPGESPGDRRGV